MTTSLAERPMAGPAVSAEQLDLVRRTVANGATDAELKLYLYDCARHGVHPLDKLLHFTKRGGKYTPVTSIDLMRMRAHDTGECIGITDPLFIGDVKDPATFEAVCMVKRLVQGHVAEFSATARWAEYYPGDGQGHMWKKMPHTMLGKCAEALALRKGFPKQLAGLYAREEMDQADRSSTPPATSVEPATMPASTGESVNAVTGEVVDPNDGLLRITKVEKSPTSTGRDRWFVHFSNGVKAATFKNQESALAEQLCQEQAGVIAETKDSGKWGHDLKSLKRNPIDRTVLKSAPDSPEPPIAIHADDIPF